MLSNISNVYHSVNITLFSLMSGIVLVDTL